MGVEREGGRKGSKTGGRHIYPRFIALQSSHTDWKRDECMHVYRKTCARHGLPAAQPTPLPRPPPPPPYLLPLEELDAVCGRFLLAKVALPVRGSPSSCIDEVCGEGDE